MIMVAAISGCIGVGIGAIGSHSLPKRLESQGLSEPLVNKKLNQCEIAVRYQIYHSLAILAIGLAPASRLRKSWIAASMLFAMGIMLFSGGLYSMVFLDRMGHWSIVPLGGGVWMVAWLALAFGALFPDKSAIGAGFPN